MTHLMFYTIKYSIQYVRLFQSLLKLSIQKIKGSSVLLDTFHLIGRFR